MGFEGGEGRGAIAIRDRAWQSIKPGIKAAAAEAKLPNLSSRIFRHSAAVWMDDARHAMNEIAQHLGHAAGRITEQITAVSPTACASWQPLKYLKFDETQWETRKTTPGKERKRWKSVT